jgi:hypothetical protein
MWLLFASRVLVEFKTMSSTHDESSEANVAVRLTRVKRPTHKPLRAKIDRLTVSVTAPQTILLIACGAHRPVSSISPACRPFRFRDRDPQVIYLLSWHHRRWLGEYPAGFSSLACVPKLIVRTWKSIDEVTPTTCTSRIGQACNQSRPGSKHICFVATYHGTRLNVLILITG